MSAWRWLRRHVCPACREPNRAEAAPTISILERSGDALDRLTDELRRIRQETADGDNPFLGPRGPQRKERPR